MDLILADLLRQHKSHDAWWFKMKRSPNAPTINNKDSMLPIMECHGENSLSQFLGIPMHALWQVLIYCKTAIAEGIAHRIGKTEHRSGIYYLCASMLR
jgi:hypothetical protein